MGEWEWRRAQEVRLIALLVDFMIKVAYLDLVSKLYIENFLNTKIIIFFKSYLIRT